MAALPQRQPWRGILPWVAAAGVVSSALRTLTFHHPSTGMYFVRNYFTMFYLLTYRDGWRRRALVGSLFRLVFPRGLDDYFLNAFACVVMAILLCVLVGSLCRLVRDKLQEESSGQADRWTPLWLFAFCASSLTSVFLAVVGDLLQVAMLLFAAAMLGLGPRLRSAAAKTALGLAVLTLCFFVHEASVMLLAPALPFFWSRRPHLKDFVLPVLLVAMLLGLSHQWHDDQVTPTWPEITHAAAPLFYPAPELLPTLKDELRAQVRRDFGSVQKAIVLSERIAAMILLVFCSVVALGWLLTPAAFTRILRVLAAVTLFCLPLYAIAFDWGRFLGLSLFVSLLAMAAQPEPEPATPQVGDRLLAMAVLSIRRLGRNPLVSLACLLVLLRSSTGVNLYSGLEDTTAAEGFLVLSVAVLQAGITRFRSRRLAQANG